MKRTMHPQREEARRAQNGRCFYCGRPISRETATADHRVPRALGGEDALANIVASCGPCNAKKADSLEADFVSRAKVPHRRSNRRRDAHDAETQARKAAERRGLHSGLNNHTGRE